MKRLLHKFCKKQIAKLQEERKQIELALEWWPAGSFSFGAARLTLALAMTESKIELWRTIIEIAKC